MSWVEDMQEELAAILLQIEEGDGPPDQTTINRLRERFSLPHSRCGARAAWRVEQTRDGQSGTLVTECDDWPWDWAEHVHSGVPLWDPDTYALMGAKASRTAWL